MKENVHVFPSEYEVGIAASYIIAAAVMKNPHLVLGLPTGQTPIPLYRELYQMSAINHINFSTVATFNLDEYAGKGTGDPDSYVTFMNEYLFNNVTFRHSFFPNGKLCIGSDIACKIYDRLIVNQGGIDLQVLGIGSNGHIGFNEPSDDWSDGTAWVKLTDQTIQDNANKFYGGNIDAVPTMAISMGTLQICKAREIVVLATGLSKATAVAEAINGPVTPQVPASRLQLHENVIWLLDEEAASKL